MFATYLFQLRRISIGAQYLVPGAFSVHFFHLKIKLSTMCKCEWVCDDKLKMLGGTLNQVAHKPNF